MNSKNGNLIKKITILKNQTISVSDSQDPTFQIIFEQSPISTQIFSPDGTLIKVNKAWEKLWGVTFEEIKGYNILKDKQLVDIHLMPRIKQAFKGHAVELGPIEYEPNKTLKNLRKIEPRWTRGIMYPIKDAKGKVIKVILQREDVTEHKRKEDELRYQKTLLEAQREVALEGILVVSPEGKMVSYNKRFVEMWKFPKDLMEKGKDELALQHATKQLVDTKGFIQRVQKLYKNKETSFDELYFKDGRVIDRYGSPVIGEDGTDYGYVWFFQDVTERKRLENQKNDFIGIVSHELKTPVTSIKAYTQVLHKRLLKQGDVTMAPHLAKINGQLNKLINLIADLLDITKIESGKLQFQEIQFDFNSLVEEMVDEMQRTSESHEIVMDLAETKLVFGDRDRIGQVIANLLSNAIKYSPHSNKIIVKTSTNKNSVLLCVQDFGIGISKEKKDKVFERFYRVEEEISHETYGGLGLGLYISAEIISRQQGRIWVDSEKGKGSTFCFSIPINQKQSIISS